MSDGILPLSVIWEQCLDLEKCVHVWPLPEVCIGVHACLRVVLENGTYYVEADVLGRRFRWGLADACYTIFTVAVGRIDICITPRSGGLRLTAKGCISAGPINQCWDLYGVDINFLTLADLDKAQQDWLVALGHSSGRPLGKTDALALAVEYERSGVREPCPCRKAG